MADLMKLTPDAVQQELASLNDRTRVLAVYALTTDDPDPSAEMTRLRHDLRNVVKSFRLIFDIVDMDDEELKTEMLGKVDLLEDLHDRFLLRLFAKG